MSPNTEHQSHPDALLDQTHRSNEGGKADESWTPGKTSLRRILSYASTGSRWALLATTILSAINGAMLPLMNVVFGRLVQNFTNYFTPGAEIPEGKFRHEINRLTLYIVYIFIGKLAMSFVTKYVFRHVGLVLTANLRKAYFIALFNQPVRAVDSLSPGSATYALTQVVTAIQNNIADKLEILIESLGLIIAAYAVGFWHSWALTLASTSLTLLALVCYTVIGPAVNKLDRQIIEDNSGAAAEASNALRMIRVVRSLGAEDAIAARHLVWNTKARKHGHKKNPYMGALFGLYFFCAYANITLTFYVGLKLYRQGQVGDIGDIVTVLFSLVAIMPAVGAIAPLLISINRAITGAQVLFELIDADRIEIGGLKAPEVRLDNDICFENVHFAYPSRPDVPVLRGLQLLVPYEKTTALMGSSGCGKSTIVGLLERWYDLSDVNYPQTTGETGSASSEGAEAKEQPDEEKPSLPGKFHSSGAIFIGEHNLEQVDRRWWRSQIGLVEQESVLFNESIYENVARGLVGSPHHDKSESEKRALVEAACVEAYAHDFIMRQSNGYETVVGEGGLKLSGGQRQRLAIARCVVKQPSILIFDEATSSIDVHSEKIVDQAIIKISRGRTCIIITHRLSTMQKADFVAVLDKGVVVEQGPREQLANDETSRYAEIVRAQQLTGGETQGEEYEDVEETDTAISNPSKDVAAEKKGLVRYLTRETRSSSIVENGRIAEEEHQKLEGYLRSLIRLIYSFRRHRLPYAMVLLAAMGAGGVVCAQSIVVSNFIVAFQDKTRLISRGNFWSLMALILTIVVTFGYVILGIGINYLSIDVSTSCQQSYFEAMLRKPISWFDSEQISSDDLTSRLSNDPQQLQEVSGPNMVLPLVGVFSVTGSLILGLIIGWKLTLIAAVAALPIILIASVTRNRFEKYFEDFNARVFVESGKYAAEGVRAFRTVVALTLEESAIKQYDELLQGHTKTAISRARLVALVFALGNSLEFCSIALTFWYGGGLLARREYDVLQFIIIFTAIVQGGQTAGVLLSLGPNLSQAKPALNRIVNMCVREKPPTTMQPTGDEPVSLQSELGARIEFRDVTFGYPSQNRYVLRGFSLSVSFGEYVAFVGASGCGKTTLLSLIQRFYTPNKGQVLIDGHDLETLPMTTFRSMCALVSQEPALFEGSVRENLTLGLPRASTQEELEEACRAAEIHDFISGLPNGYDTQLSAALHANMSGGQKQRMCIARALMRRPRLLLLDEATSSLDSQNEAAIQRAIERMAGTGKLTIISVAHRLATVQNADRIFVLGQGGQLLEQGKHQDLLRRKGVYWQMCEAQALLAST